MIELYIIIAVLVFIAVLINKACDTLSDILVQSRMQSDYLSKLTHEAAIISNNTESASEGVYTLNCKIGHSESKGEDE